MTPSDRWLPYLRHKAMCFLQAVRDNAPHDPLCTCGLADEWADQPAPFDVDRLARAISKNIGPGPVTGPILMQAHAIARTYWEDS